MWICSSLTEEWCPPPQHVFLLTVPFLPCWHLGLTWDILFVCTGVLSLTASFCHLCHADTWYWHKTDSPHIQVCARWTALFMLCWYLGLAWDWSSPCTGVFSLAALLCAMLTTGPDMRLIIPMYRCVLADSPCLCWTETWAWHKTDCPCIQVCMCSSLTEETVETTRKSMDWLRNCGYYQHMSLACSEYEESYPLVPALKMKLPPMTPPAWKEDISTTVKYSPDWLFIHTKTPKMHQIYMIRTL